MSQNLLFFLKKQRLSFVTPAPVPPPPPTVLTLSGEILTSDSKSLTIQ